MTDTWPTHASIEHLAWADMYIEASAQAYDAILPTLGDVLRDIWPQVRPLPTCDCELPHHRWNCHLTPIWAQTIRELDTNPWDWPAAVEWIERHFRVVKRPFRWDGSLMKPCGRGPCCLGDGHDGRCRT